MKELHSILTHGPLIPPPCSFTLTLDTHTQTQTHTVAHCCTVSESLLFGNYCHEILPRSAKLRAPVEVEVHVWQGMSWQSSKLIILFKSLS